MNITEKLENCRKALLAAEKLIAAQASLMACLRISKRPSEKTLDEVGKKAGVDIQIARAIHDATIKGDYAGPINCSKCGKQHWTGAACDPPTKLPFENVLH